jgi:hypothetical protein
MRVTQRVLQFQMFDTQLGLRGDQQREADDILQLADISRPGVARQRLQDLLSEHRGWRIQAPRVQSQEMSGECGHISPALPQGQQSDLGHVEPIKQVEPEMTRRDGFTEVDCRCGHQPDICLLRIGELGSTGFAVFQDTQELTLQADGQSGNFIEE